MTWTQSESKMIGKRVAVVSDEIETYYAEVGAGATCESVADQFCAASEWAQESADNMAELRRDLYVRIEDNFQEAAQ